MSELSKYDLRGVSSTKEEVHIAIKNLDKGLYKNTFCKILPDIISGSPDYCCVMHVDTAGSKPSLAYIYWKETKDLSVWKGIAQDAIVMNIDDMACVGITDQFILSSNIARNKINIPGEVITSIIQGTQQILQDFQKLGINIHHAGGETADVGDIVRTIDVGFTLFARTKRKNIIENNIKPGNVVVGLSSFGKSTYEFEYNSGIASNGLTSARHDVLSNFYAQKYPESFDVAIDKSLIYTGSKHLTDIDEPTKSSIGKLLLSPTRTYLPVLKEIFQNYFSNISGIIHCTGGGQTKVLKFIDNVHVIKNNLFEIPPVFNLIKNESDTSWKEMYQTYNMGHRMEIYTDELTAEKIIEISKKYEIDAKIVGFCESYSGKKVSIYHHQEIFEYLP